ncbi:nitrate/nitrite transporter [Cytobacillus sp. IB215665]|uniref:nitrate/nitrite transporter n=1 Tax=Cytobacillus sp. IB215665 TaxID=3097357 RepID=UPI0039B734E3
MRSTTMNSRPIVQLSLQTVSLIASFMVWVILSSLMPFISQDLTLSTSQIALITSAPVISGSLLRIPIGFLTSKHGASNLFIANFIILLIPVYLVSISTSFIHLFILGLILGISGATFSIGVTSLPKYFNKAKHGLVNGIFGLGNIGTAFTSFLAPIIANELGWRLTIQFYLFLIAFMVIANFILGDKKEKTVNEKFVNPLKYLKQNQAVSMLSLFYFLTFGTFVTFTVLLPTMLVSNYNIPKVESGFITAIFIIIATLIRPIGGLLADKFNPYVILILVFVVIGIVSIVIALTNEYAIFVIAIMTISFCSGIGNGVVFKLVPLLVKAQTGTANGIVAATGSLGGFFPPLIIAYIVNLTNSYSVGFAFFTILSIVCLTLTVSANKRFKVSVLNEKAAVR